MKAKLLLIIFTLCVISVTGQTLPEIEQKYGKPTLAYTVAEHSWMTPDFASDGQVCRMRIYAKRFYRDTAYVNGDLRSWELKWFLNQLVPPSSRGDRKTTFGVSTLLGPTVQTVYEYEKVSFTFAYTLRLSFNPASLKRLRNESEPILLDSFEVPGNIPKPPAPSDNDFDLSIDPEVVVLRWKDRTCAQDDDAAFTSNRGVEEIEQQYGQPEKIYSDGSISMTPSFDAEGQACRMWLYAKPYALGKTLLLDQLQDVLSRLVPVDQRGRMGEVSRGDFSGKVGFTTYPYEKALFTFWTVLPPSNQSLQVSKPDDTGLVRVQWRHRQCLNDR